MKARILMSLGGASVLILSGSAEAVYTGLSVENVGIQTTPVGPRQVWRVYVNFTDPNDYLTGVNGSSTNGPLHIQTRNADDSGLGTNFFNPGSAATGNTAPADADGNLQWGTFATIGVTLSSQALAGSSGDMVSLSPGFPNFINGNQIMNSNMGWFTAGPVLQGMAGWTGDGDFALRVACMQLAVNVGEHVRGTVNIVGVTNEGLGGGNFLVGQQTFTSVPAPAGWLMPLMAALSCRPGRRRFVGEFRRL